MNKKPKRLPDEALREAMLERDDWSCRKCGFRDLTGSHLQAHHVKPHRTGGKTELDNLHTLCGMCHAELSWLWHESPPIPYEQWLTIVSAGTLIRSLLIVRGDHAPVFVTQAEVAAALGIDQETAERLLRKRP